ncbi:hypothetical protein DFP73DRAFT_395187 [Morchella snyderi]|nr:hypothetical protein DFP73DRAFT_395187 [Morchella snyderi]
MVINNSQVAIGDGAQVNINREPAKAKAKSKTRSKVKSKSKRKCKRAPSEVSDSDGEAHPGWSPSSFVQMYSKMEEQFMWKLPSGSFVETVLYQKLKSADRECLAHSFVLDVKNKNVEKLFKPSDWSAILEKVPAWPAVDGEAAEFMKEFKGVGTAAELREMLAAAAYLPAGKTYDREKHYDRYWIHMVITMLLPLFENPDQPLLGKNDECWYDVRLWGIIIDTLLDEIRGLSTRRRELPILAGARRKNRRRDDTAKRQKIGARFDGLVQDGGGKYEYAAMEGSRAFVSETGTKWLHDYGKVAKALHDMMYSLQSEVGNEVAALEKLHLAGVVSAGLHCQVLRMSYAKGYVCLLSCDTLCQVPQTASELPLLFQLLGSVLRMKTMLTESKALIDNYPSTRSFEQLLEPAKLTTSRLVIPMSCDTEGEGGESA